MPEGGPPPAHAGFRAELRIDWIGHEELGDGRRGRLGLTFLPGKRGASMRYPGHVYRRDTLRDLIAMRDLGVRRLVLLVEDHELTRWGDPDIVRLGQHAAVEVVRHPVPDGSAPSAEQLGRILADVSAGREAGDVALACMGGVGRAGTIAACALVAAGLGAEDAIRTVRRVRHSGAIETRAQEALVRRFARR